jgi:ribosomal protein S18 acetylase RimI-like enzyme
MFPISYQDKFYNDTISDPIAASISLVALWHDTSEHGSSSPSSKPRVVAAIRCRLLTSSPSSTAKTPSKHDSGTFPSLYISTIATLSPFRNHGLAQALLQIVTRRALNDYGVKTISAHVWEANTEGRQWYAKHGFKEVHFEKDYYRKLKPNGAWVVERPISIADFLN